jgi:hypothetical protein
MGKEEIKKEIIECECGTHLLMIQSEVEIFDSTNSDTDKPRVRQEFDLAMFTYGTYHKKPSLCERIRVVWNYLRTGKMHEDQLIFHPDEAQKLADFINKNIVPTEK